MIVRFLGQQERPCTESITSIAEIAGLGRATIPKSRAGKMPMLLRCDKWGVRSYAMPVNSRLVIPFFFDKEGRMVVRPSA